MSRSCSWMRFKLNYKFNEIPIKILIEYFTGLGKFILKLPRRGNVPKQ